MAQLHSPAVISAHGQVVALALHSPVQALGVLEVQEAAQEAILEFTQEAALAAAYPMFSLVCQAKVAQEEQA